MNNQLEIGQRIKRLRDERGWSQQDLADKSGGVRQPTISRIERGLHDETTDSVLARLSVPLEVSVNFLRYGATDERSSNVKPVKKVPARKIPVISWVRAGEWTEAIDLHQPGVADDWIVQPTTKKMSDRTYALLVEGDSMTNPVDQRFNFPPGCHIIVDPEQRTPDNGQLVVARLDGTDTVTFKQFKIEDGRPYLKPFNPDFKPIFDKFVILGRVVGKRDYQEY